MGWPSERSRDGGIDEVPVPGVAGRMWLCGKHAIGPDVEAALVRAGATTVVCLTELYELADRYPDYVEWLAANAPARAIHHPVADFHAPDVDAVTPFLDDLHARLVAGEVLLVHCGAGIGRAGTIAVAVLVRAGVPLDEALATVRAHRPMAGPEAGVQAELLEAVDRARQRRDG